MALQTQAGNFVIVGANTPTPTYFWKGTRLTEVLRASVHHDENNPLPVRLRVQNTTNFDVQYAEMTAANINIKKGL